MAPPSIKGTVMDKVVEDLRRLREAGLVSRDDLEAALSAEALALLEEKVVASTWYPVEIYQGMVDVLWRVEGHRSADYMRRRGEESAERLVAAGVYRQLTRLQDGSLHAGTFEEFMSTVRLVASLHAAIINFGRVEVARDPQHPKRVLMEVHDAAAYPESLRLATEGFMTRAGREVGRRFAWRSQRISRDHVRFRMLDDFDA